MKKLNSPVAQSLPKECQKAANILRSFVDRSNNGLDGVIPRHILESAKGFAIFTIFKAGFLFSARGGSGIVIAKLEDGGWSAPSGIATAGMGFGGQAGAEMTDFLIVLNSRAAVRSFMSSGSVTLGGNMSVAVGPLGRNGEAIGSLNANGKVAAMYSYSKTKGLFGGLSIEGSVMIERSDANCAAYNSPVTAAMLLSGVVPRPEWADSLVSAIESSTGIPGGHKWVSEPSADQPRLVRGYSFSGMGSPGSITPSNSLKKKKKNSISFPPPSWGRQKSGGGYFESKHDAEDDYFNETSQHDRSHVATGSRSPQRFSTYFESDYVESRPSPRRMDSAPPVSSPFSSSSPFKSNDQSHLIDDLSGSPEEGRYLTRAKSHSISSSSAKIGGGGPSLPRHIAPKAALSEPLDPSEGVGRAIALYDFNAVEPGDLSFSKGQVLIIVEKSNSTEDWWKGKLDGRQGIFPANFVEYVPPVNSHNPFD